LSESFLLEGEAVRARRRGRLAAERVPSSGKVKIAIFSGNVQVLQRDTTMKC
jgi:hypothetical protein